MENESDIIRAWRFVNGFNVPRMGVEERNEWMSIIARIPVDDWQRACRKAMDRPDDALRFRPSPMEFRAYAKGQSPPRIPPFPKKDDGPLTASDVAAKDEWLQKSREFLRRNTVMTSPSLSPQEGGA